MSQSFDLTSPYFHVTPEIRENVRKSKIALVTYRRAKLALATGQGTPYHLQKWRILVDLVEAGVPVAEATRKSREGTKPHAKPEIRYRNHKPCVYLITCIPSGRQYVGQTSASLNSRMQVHMAIRGRIRKMIAAGEGGLDVYLDRWGNAAACSPVILEEIFRYPEESMWKVETLFEMDRGELTRKEIRDVLTPIEEREIHARGTLSPGGLNSNVGFTPCAKTRQRVSETMKGRKKSPEQRERMSESQKRRWETRERKTQEPRKTMSREEHAAHMCAYYAAHPEHGERVKAGMAARRAREAGK